MDRTTFQALAQLRLDEAKALLDSGFYAGAYYLTGYAIECALKACISKQIHEHTMPTRKFINDFYTHDLNTLLALAGLREQLMAAPARAANWRLVKDWSEQARYSITTTEQQAHELHAACTNNNDGVFIAVAERHVVIEAKEPLAPYMVDVGWRLLEAISEQVHFSTALWFYWEPSNSWRLIITLPGVRQSGTKKFYVLILDLLHDARQLSPDEKAEADHAADSLMVIDEEDALARDIRQRIVGELGRHQFGQHLFPRGPRHGRYMHDGYVYRFTATQRELLDAPLQAGPDERAHDERRVSDN